MNKTVLIIIVSFLGAGVFAQAQTLTDGPHVGFSFGGDVRNEDFVYGYQATYRHSPIFSIEASLSLQNDELEHNIDDVMIPNEFNIDMEVFALAVSGRLGFHPLKRVYLYATAGAGYYFMKTDAEEVRKILASQEPNADGVKLAGLTVDAENDFGYHAGAGCEIMLGERWGVFVEYRQVFLEVDADLKITEEWPSGVSDNPRMMQTRFVSDTLPYDYSLVRAGINYRF